MSLRKLYDKFKDVTELPVEIPEIRDAIKSFGIQDEIVICHTTLDEKELYGVFYQYTERKQVYGDPELTTLIIYPDDWPRPIQRLICAKELIHVMDAATERVDTPAKVQALVEKLLGPLSSEDLGISDLIAAKDKMAIYRSIPLLFPSAAREVAYKMLKDGKTTVEAIAKWASVPFRVADLVMQDAWPQVEKELLEDC